MNMKRKTIFSVIIFAAFLGVAYFAYTSLSSRYRPDQENQVSEDNSSIQELKNQAKDFTVFDAEGNKVKLSNFKGKPIVLNFWASWCPQCKSEMPHFNEVYADALDDVQFMMVDLTDGKRETQSDGQKYVENMGYDFPVYFDKEQQASNIYAISSIPTTYFIDAEGDIVKSYVGAIDKKTIIYAINLIKK